MRPQEHFEDWNTDHEPWSGCTPLPIEPMLDTRYQQPVVSSSTYEEELGRLIGLAGPKAEVKRLADFARMNQQRKAQGLPALSNSLHMAFLGGPGTGKTSFARIIATVLKDTGILARGHLVEVDRSALVGTHIGQSEPLIMAKLMEALGGVLFIDEFYALATASDWDFGRRVIDVLVKFMEDHRHELCVIIAGYPEPMTKAISSNPGLKRRLGRIIHFPDYSAEDLMEIFDGFIIANKYALAVDAYPAVVRAIISHHANRGPDFGNAGDMRNFFERVTETLASRAMHDGSSITHILKDDIEQAAKLCLN